MGIQGTPEVYTNTWYKVSKDEADHSLLQAYSDGYRVVLSFTMGIILNENSRQGTCFMTKDIGGICHTVQGDGGTAGDIVTNGHKVKWFTSTEWSDTLMSATTGTLLTDGKYGLSVSPTADSISTKTGKATLGKALKATWY